jgi:hypothetical protein
MRITGSDHGDAQGRADVRLNRDRNEVDDQRERQDRA